MTAIMSSIYAVETSSNPPERLEPWKVELHAPNSQIRAEEACTDCGRIHLVNLTSLRGVRNVAQGITCPQFGATCLLTTGSSGTPLSSAAAPIPPHAQETYHTPSMGNPHCFSRYLLPYKHSTQCLPTIPRPTPSPPAT